MLQNFRITSSSTLANPSAETLIARSVSASDTQSLSITGSTSVPTNVSETHALTGQKEVAFPTNTLVLLTGAKLASAAAGIITIYGQGTHASGDIRVDAQPANNDTLTIGLTGYTVVYTFKTTLTGAAREIKLGADKYVTAQNICRALIAGTGSGTSYGTGTTAHPDITAWADSAFTDNDLNGTSETTIYIRDALAISRYLTWGMSTTSANLSVRAPSGGENGTTIATLDVGDSESFESMTLSSPDLATATLIALTTPTTDALFVGSRPCSIRLYIENVSSSISAKVQLSDDNLNWYDDTSGALTLDNNDQRIDLTARLSEYVRLAVTANANTTDSKLHAVALIG